MMFAISIPVSRSSGRGRYYVSHKELLWRDLWLRWGAGGRRKPFCKMGRKGCWLGYESIQFLGLFVFVGLQEHQWYLKNKKPTAWSGHNNRKNTAERGWGRKQHLSQEHWPCQLASKWLHILCFIRIILRIWAEMSLRLLRDLTT